jgi:4'-phosphopantetheinyl transferase
MEEVAGDPTIVWLWAAAEGDDAGLPYSALSEAELDMGRRHSSRSAETGYLRAHALLRLALAYHTGLTPEAVRYQRRCRWCGDPAHGRPTLEAGSARPVSFSLTWRSGLSLVAISEADVGVDAERSGRRPVPTGHHVAAPGEIERLESSFGRPIPQNLLAQWWTAKEAVGKARGSGLVGMDRLPLVPGSGSWCPVVDSHVVWHVRSLAVGAHGVASVACRRPFVADWKRPA